MLTASKALCVIGAAASRRFFGDDMNPAPFAILAALFFASAAAAQPNETEAVDDAIACLNITDDGERLSCLEKAAKTLQVTRIVREEEAAAAKENEKANFGLAGVDDKAPDQVAETADDFGAENIPEVRREKENKRLKSINAKIVEIRLNRIGDATVYLENGQVWRQLDSDNKKLVFGNSDRLLTAKVKRGIMGNYMLIVNELRRTIRVERIK